MTHHRLAADSLHGFYSRDLEPVLVVDSGDTVTCSTLDGDWLAGPALPDGSRGPEWPGRVPGRDLGHALCGPVGIAGARPGQTLEVRVDRLVPASWGWSRVGGRPVDHDIRLGVSDGEELYLNWTLDRVRGTATSHLGHVVAMHPFMGVMGMPADVPGHQSTHPPRRTGGNIDCAALGVGTSLFLPVEVPGGLFSVGDGHAAQGDGEVGSTAIECPMDAVELTLVLHDAAITGPRARTPDAWLTFGFDEDLENATYQALNAMVDLVAESFEVPRKEALAMCSPVVDLRVTQIVNGVRGVHALLRHGAIIKSKETEP